MDKDGVELAFEVIDKIISLGILAVLLKFWTTQYTGIRNDFIGHMKTEIRHLRGLPEKTDDGAV